MMSKKMEGEGREKELDMRHDEAEHDDDDHGVDDDGDDDNFFLSPKTVQDTTSYFAVVSPIGRKNQDADEIEE